MMILRARTLYNVHENRSGPDTVPPLEIPVHRTRGMLTDAWMANCPHVAACQKGSGLVISTQATAFSSFIQITHPTLPAVMVKDQQPDILWHVKQGCGWGCGERRGVASGGMSHLRRRMRLEPAVSGGDGVAATSTSSSSRELAEAELAVMELAVRRRN